MTELCEGCSACCRYIRLPIATLDRDVLRWLRFHGCKQAGGYLIIPLPCEKLKNGRCTVYAHRPFMCQRMPVGGMDCLAAKQLQKEGVVSPNDPE